MNLQNGYKVIYEKAANGKRTFYASKTGFFKDAEIIAEATIGEYKLIYEKDGLFYGSTTGIPTDNDHCFEEFKLVFEEGYSAEDSSEELVPEDPKEDDTTEIPGTETEPEAPTPENSTEEPEEEPEEQPGEGSGEEPVEE